jgi:hypothetical protein
MIRVLFERTLRLLAPSLVLAAGLLTIPVGARADQVTISPSRDNTLYEGSPDSPTPGTLSNGAGFYLYVGRNAQSTNSLRRGLLAFDLQGIAPGSTIESVSLTLFMSRTKAGAKEVRLHRVNADWGEGVSNAELPFIDRGGDGAAATPNDATWVHRFSPGQFWSTPGGDFAPQASAVASVAGIGAYSWGSSVGMVADVQAWVDHPESNFGWILIGDETTPITAKRFSTRENEVVEERPKLAVQFTPPILPPEGGLQLPGNINGDGTIDISDAVATLGALFQGIPARFPCAGGNPDDPANVQLLDWQPDGRVDVSDAVSMLAFFFLGGPPHALSVPGEETKGCIRIIGCQDKCSG